MKVKCLFVICLAVFFNTGAATVTYYCPKTPINIKIGEIIDNQWYIWPDEKPKNFYNKYYYKLFSHSYKFNYWSAFPYGLRKGEYKGKSNFIGCCGWLKKDKKLICAYKYISENNCKPIFPSGPPVKFSCKNVKSITKRSS